MVDWGDIAGGAATGGALGGPWGAAAGGLLGAASSFFGGKKKKNKLQNYNYNTPAQDRYQNSLLGGLEEPTGNALDWLNRLVAGDQEAFDAYEAPYLERFNEEFVPQIIEQIMGRGSGSKGSSALNRALAQGARGLSRDLAAQKASLMDSAIGRLQAYGQQGLNRNQAPYIQEGSRPGFLESVAPYAATSLIDRYSSRAQPSQYANTGYNPGQTAMMAQGFRA